MWVARQRRPDAAAGGTRVCSAIAARVAPAPHPGGTVGTVAAPLPTGPRGAGLGKLRGRTLADALAGGPARLGPRHAARLGAAGGGGVRPGARRTARRVHV